MSTVCAIARHPAVDESGDARGWHATGAVSRRRGETGRLKGSRMGRAGEGRDAAAPMRGPSREAL